MNNTYPGCEICEVWPTIPSSLIIDENEFWSANLAYQDQSCLGKMYVTLKRHAPELDQLTNEEDASFITLRNGLIQAVRQQFKPVTFNFSCLKNDAFRNDPNNTPPEASHVHWHVVPRYGSEPTEFAGETFLDPSPGRYLSATREKKPVGEDLATAIASTIRDNYVRQSV